MAGRRALLRSLWKRSYYHSKPQDDNMSPKHLQRYVNEFAARHNMRDKDTLDQMNDVVCSLVGKRLMYRDLIAPTDLSRKAA